MSKTISTVFLGLLLAGIPQESRCAGRAAAAAACCYLAPRILLNTVWGAYHHGYFGELFSRDERVTGAVNIAEELGYRILETASTDPVHNPFIQAGALVTALHFGYLPFLAIPSITAATGALALLGERIKRVRDKKHAKKLELRRWWYWGSTIKDMYTALSPLTVATTIGVAVALKRK